MLELGNLAGDGLHRETQVVGEIEASERNLDLDRGEHGRAHALRRLEKEGGDPFVGTRSVRGG